MLMSMHKSIKTENYTVGIFYALNLVSLTQKVVFFFCIIEIFY